MAGDLTLGPGVTLSGTVSVPGRAVIHGTLDGTLTARDVLVGPEGRVLGVLEADSVELQGEGPATLTVRTGLVIRASGRVTGTVRYGRLEVEPGGLLQGDIAPLAGERSGGAVGAPPSAATPSAPAPAVAPSAPAALPPAGPAAGRPAAAAPAPAGKRK
jgi:cytoskeletal protein CcmA (bactofilin family)